MKKAFTSILVLALLMVILFTCIGCYSCNGLFTDNNDDGKKDNRLYTDYFEYYVLWSEVTITNNTEKALENDYLVIPDEIDGYPVTRIQFLGLGYHEDKKLQQYVPTIKRIYLSKNVQEMPSRSWGAYGKFECIYLGVCNPHECDTHLNISYHHEAMYLEAGAKVYSIVNINYLYNFENAPNEDVYFLDDLEEGEPIKYIPDSPQREGFEFTGWYFDKECTQVIDIESFVYGEEMGIIDFFAGWREIE